MHLKLENRATLYEKLEFKTDEFHKKSPPFSSAPKAVFKIPTFVCRHSPVFDFHPSFSFLMSLSTTSDNSNDILWIETRVPSIASIYYNLHLRHTHALYCPDDNPVTPNDESTIEPVKQKHVRDLARDILRVIDSVS
jgi:hypothetical protein